MTTENQVQTTQVVQTKRGNCPRCGKECDINLYPHPVLNDKVVEIPACLYCEGVIQDEIAHEKALKLAKNREKEDKILNLSEKHKHLKLKTYPVLTEEHKKARNKVLRYIKSFDGTGWLGLFGSSGTGRTSLLTIIVKSLYAHNGIQGRFIDYSELLNELYRGSEQLELTSAQIEKFYKTVGLLCIDDFAMSESKLSSRVAGILDYRYRQQKAVVIATGLVQIDKGLAKKTLDRIDNQSVVTMDYESLRKVK